MNISEYRQTGKPCMSYNCYKRNTDPFRTKQVVVDNNYTSINNKLVGGQNPKTLIPPVITTPCYSLAWKASDMVVPSRINARSNDDLYRSGYISKDDKEPQTDAVYDFKKSFREAPIVEPNRLNSTIMTPQRLGLVKENFEELEQFEQGENVTLPDYSKKDWENKVNTACGYNINQLENSKFPANLPRGRTEQSSDLSDYNTQLFTQTVQPGLYYREDVVEPVNSNIGISFQQQFLPRSTITTSDGKVVVQDTDPEFTPEIPVYNSDEQKPSIDNVYDPRFWGYGTAERCYIDNVTGQPRYPYDDINAIKMPNYITRNKLDTQNFVDIYGPIKDSGKGLNEVRALANEAFYRDTEQHRNSITVDAMRKMNAAMWQRRKAPIRR